MFSYPVTSNMLSSKTNINDQLLLDKIIGYINRDMLQRDTKKYTYAELSHHLNLPELKLIALMDKIDKSENGLTVSISPFGGMPNYV